MDFEYALFMAEAVGYLDTHESKVQRVFRDVKYRYDAGQGELTVHDGYLGDFGLTFESLSSYDLQRMAKVVETGRI